MLSPATVGERFGGLNLADDPAEVGSAGAVDLLNVMLDRRGRVRQRYGYTSLATMSGSSNGDYAVKTVSFYDSANSRGLYAVLTATGYQILDETGGTPTGGAFSASAYNMDAVALGVPGATTVYMTANPGGTVGVTPVLPNAVNFTLPSNTSGKTISVTPWDNRLVLGNTYESGPTYDSRVRFCDAGAPLTFTANNYVDLHPGDGQNVSNLVRWQDSLFAFKQTKFFVFYGVSTDAAGEPIFNYRTVDTGVGSVGSSSASATALPDAVYFMSKDGIWRTTGGPPERVPSPFDVLLRSETPAYFSGITSTTAASARLSYAFESLVVSVYTSTAPDRVTFIYHPPTNTWTYWDASVAGFAQRALGQTASTYNAAVLSATGAKPKLVEFQPALTTDNGTSITSKYRSGLYDLGTPNDKVIRASEVQGTGTVGFAVSTNHDAVPTARTLTLGTSPSSSSAYVNYAPKPGRYNSYQLSSVNGAAWQVDSITHHLRPSRAPAMRAAA